ncbi:MAG TPA: hypothetical protein EYN67_10875 [Flavobacteriales bacterium]|jgi:hypothetical protein|nr:hypothetical protein [Chromatiaceae bacterium]HHZ96033.1 hypothetical protein [Flavobacteriales bacterium]HIB84278.1 hypothetical protein [Chromatiaceae bacterium]HIN82105.1 hypothetical protein [Chromatiales bacterium]HIP10509.1 hypothetical protein [Rhodospirillales bacterium]
MTNNENNSSEECCGPVDPSMISPVMRNVYIYISDTLLKEGRMPSLEEVAGKTKQPLEVIKQVLDGFEGVAGIYRDPFFNNVIAFYPVSAIPTIHKIVRPDGGRIAYSPCAMDALTLAPTLERKLDIKSACRYCDHEILINYNDDGSKIIGHTPDDIWIWIEDRIPSDAPYYLVVCINTNFFCCKEHLDQWRAEETITHSGKPYSLSEAFAAFDLWCTYKMYKLVVEGRPWGGKALDQI